MCHIIIYTSVNYDNNVVIVGILLSLYIPSVVNVSVPFTELHKHAYLYCSVLVQKCIVYQQIMAILL